MNAEKKLARKFYNKFYFSLVLTTACSLGLIAIITYIIANFRNGQKDILWILVAIVVLVAIVWGIKGMTPYFHDLHSVRNKEYLTITGAVMKHKKYVDTGGDSIIVTYNPVVKDDITDEEIELKAIEKVNKVKDLYKINERYTIIYLKHTRLAIIKEKH